MSGFVGGWPPGGEAALDGRYRICGDVRLDAREELIAALSSRGDAVLRAASDAALVLLAFRAWGPACMARLHGDFAFAIRDEAAQRVFCARDRFGVRPFFYAQFPDLLLASGTIEALRRHPRVGSAPYEPALADYLVVGNLLEPDRSFFVDIRRLPPAHTLTFEDGAARIERYWSLSVEPELRYRREAEYVEHFAELLSRAVADRTPSGEVTLFLSGGLDSSAIAAVLAGKLGNAANAGTRALCLGWNGVFADPEPHLARETAGALGLPLSVHEFADAEPFRGWDSAAGIGPEPEDDFYRANTLHSLKLAATHSPVALFGRGGDEIFAHETLVDELRRGANLGAVADTLAARKDAGQRPPLGLRSAFRRERPPSWIQVPPWLASDWIAPLRIEERLRALDSPDPAVPRANARYRLSSARWTAGFEFADAGHTGVAVDCRYPFMDERVVGFALRLPPLRWCADKALLRRALAPLLPRVARRPKVLLAGEPLRAWADAAPQLACEQLARGLPLGGRVDEVAWRQAWEAPGADANRGIRLWRLGRIHALARWLNATRPAYAALRAVA